MNIRCKFRCQSVTPAGDPPYLETVKFFALYDPNNKDDQGYSEATPSGSVEFSVTKKSLFGHFKVGESYYFTVSPEKAE